MSDSARQSTLPRVSLDRRSLLATAAVAPLSSVAAIATPSAQSSAAPGGAYRPSALYKPQEAAAALVAVDVPAPPALNHFKVGVTSNPRTWPLINKTVRTPGAQMEVVTGAPGELFRRQLTRAEFDISEMSMSFMLIANLTGDERLIPLPVFTSRYFFHSLTLVRRGAGIRRPADLKGKRVGVPEYMMTGALWTRGVLKDEFGVRPEDIDWWLERLPAASQGTAVGKAIPPSVAAHQIPEGKSVGSMMLAGELDAAIMYIWAEKPTPDVRSSVNLYDHPAITTLFPDPIAENARYFAKTGIHHINHGAALLRSTVERAPGLPQFAMGIFTAANRLADVDREEAIEYYRDLGMLDTRSRVALQKPLVRYGYEANKRTLDTLARYSFEQGFVPRLVNMSDFFVDVRS